MKKLLNTLYVTSADSYLALDGENVVILEKENELGRLPLHNLEAIISFGYRGTSPALMGACAERNVSLCYVTPQGRFLARISGKTKGNVLLRKKQYAVSMDEMKKLSIARNCIMGKVHNARWVLERAVRDHSMQIDVPEVKAASDTLKRTLKEINKCEDIDRLRGLEGEAASTYFRAFDELILQQKKDFIFQGRNKRPPMAVGLDPYVGFMHTDRPGRCSLALDMMEELRSSFADRFVLTLINKKIVTGKQFKKSENGAVILKEDARKVVLIEWQKRKKEEIVHPFLEEKVEWGLVPFVQAMLLARYLRGDLEEYPPFLWK